MKFDITYIVKAIDVTIEQLKLSVSKAKLFKDCKRKFKYRYIERRPTKEWEHLTFGSMVHKVLEDFHKFYIDNPNSNKPHHEVMSLAFRNALKEFKGKLTIEMKREAREVISTYLKIVRNDFPNVLTCEENFSYLFKNNVLLRGFIDRVQIDEDGVLHVCDYKSSKSDKYLIGDEFQLLVYAFIMLKKNPALKKIRGSYIMIKDNYKMVGEDVNKPFEFNTEQILEVENMFLNYAVDIRQETEYEPNPTTLCNWCDYVNDCPEGKRKVFITPVYGEVSW